MTSRTAPPARCAATVLATVSIAAAVAAIGALATADDGSEAPRPPAGLRFGESFDDARLTERGWYDGGPPRIVRAPEDVTAPVTAAAQPSASWPVPFRGAGCIEYEWKTPGADGSNPVTGSTTVRHLFEPSELIYLRFYVRLSKGWSWTGKPFHPHLTHFMTTENDKWQGPAASHLTVYVEPVNGKLRLAAQDIENANAPHGLTQGPLRGGYNGRMFDSEDVLFVDDAWHCVEACFQLNSLDLAQDRPNADGVVRGWFDGRLVIERTDVVLRSTDFPEMKFNQFLLAPYFGKGLLPHAQTLWIDELAVGVERIGVLAAGGPGEGGAADPDAWLRVRVQAVRIADDDGGRPADVSPAEVTAWLATANEVYAAARIEFLFDGAADFSDARSTVVNDMSGSGDARWWESVVAGNRIASGFPDRLVLLIRHGPGATPTGGGFGATDYDFVVLPGFRHTSVCGHQNGTLAAHEIGHHLGLQHTFARAFATVAEAEAFFAAAGCDAACFDGDGLADTPPDPFVTQLQCGTDETLTLADATLPIPRANIMGYWEAPRRSLSPLQIAAARATLRERVAGHGALPVNTGAVAPQEGESLRIVARHHCNAAPQAMADWGAHRWSGGRQLWCGGDADAVLTVECVVPRSGRYRVDLYGTRAPDFARVRVAIGDDPIGGVVDFHAPTVQPTGAVTLGTVRLAAGRHRVAFRVDGRDDAARAYGFGLDCIDFVPVR